MKPHIESGTKSPGFQGLLATERRGDLIALGAILVLRVVGGWDLVSGGVVVSKDPITQYSHLGESLRH